jgi:hypothetical protein
LKSAAAGKLNIETGDLIAATPCLMSRGFRGIKTSLRTGIYATVLLTSGIFAVLCLCRQREADD